MKLHRTQPAVSQAVRRLEATVGERLFDRTTKDARLTDAGRLLRDYG
jgi:DNA-binding transcriptional LysR family regulator